MEDTEVSKYAGIYAPGDATTALAIAIAEHGGGTINPAAVNRNTNGSTDTGIWQINSVHERNHPDWTVAALKDPKTNAEAMAAISGNGTNWQPWSTYRDGKYKAYMERAQKARDQTSGSGGLGTAIDAIGDIATSPFEAVKAVASAVVGFAQTLAGFFAWVTDPDTWRRVALVALGGAVAVVGVAVLARGTEIGQTAEDIARKV